MPKKRISNLLAWLRARSLAIGLGLGLAAALTSLMFLLAQRRATDGRAGTDDKARAQAIILNKGMRAMQAEADSLRALLTTRERVGFPELLARSHYPAFVFVDTTLVFWSITEQVPPAAQASDTGWHLRHGQAGLWIERNCAFAVREQPYKVQVRWQLFRSYPVDNTYLRSGWAVPGLGGMHVVADSTAPTQAWAHTPTHACLCAITYKQPVGSTGHPNTTRHWWSLAAFGLSTLLALLVGVLLLARRRRYRLALGMWGIGLLGLRIALTYLLPGNAEGLSGLAGIVQGSLVQLLLTVGLLAVFLAGVFRFFFRAWGLGLLERLVRILYLEALLATTGALMVLLFAYRTMRRLYDLTSAMPDASRGLRLSWEGLAALGVFVGVALGLFFVLHLAARLLTRLRLELGARFWGLYLGGVALAAIALWLGHSRAWVPVGAGALLLAATIRLRLPEYLFKLRYQTYFYLFSMAVVAALTGAQGYLRHREQAGYLERLKYARRLLAQGDPLGEYLLSEMQGRLRADTTLPATIAAPDSGREGLEDKLRRQYSDNYFEQYKLDIGLYDASGNLIAGQGDASNYPALLRQVRQNMGQTGYPGLYYSHMPSDEIFKRYICLAPLYKAGGAAGGHAVLDLKMRRLPEASIFPALLVDGPAALMPVRERFSFAVYDSGAVAQQDGPFNYERGFAKDWLTGPSNIYTIRQNGWEHTVFIQADGERVVVSAPDTRLRDAFANFSLLLLVLVGLILLFIIGYTIQQQTAERRLSFAGKIQIYLNAAFFLPLTVFGMASFALVEVSLRADLNAAYLQRARNAAASLAPVMEQLGGRRLSAEAFKQRLDDLANYTGLDASLFSAKGKLLYSSHPLIYRKRLLSPYINPEALTQLADEGLRETLLPEQLGKLHYTTAYVAVRQPRTRQIAAVLAVPFFEAGSELETQLANALATEVNAFTAVFIVFMLISYLASQVLVVPLKLITQKLRRTQLGDTEELVWPSQDEIGLLVDGYNGMLRKLEASRSALARSEKESAWREMAQQVAHEIKNPLTPMKLTVQQLQRVSASGAEEAAPRIGKALDNLLGQIDALSDIASSFSDFARMPEPVPERFDLSALLRALAELHRAGSGATIELSLPEIPAYVLADKGILQGIVTNLILNGLQAARPDVPPVLQIDLQKRATWWRLRVEDNGQGIPPDVAAQVFTPHFSTKFGGSGIGLALAKRGIEQAGGRIWFESAAGQGAVFYVELQRSE